ncbi:hypothetical protein CLV84_1144 [Neolewinella xylanilytica]|uniref:Glycosyl hydrolase family 43 n=1 Tax=Neolewinella xylanilytica TaxID=1514080 RepID=A0A2S6I9P2_9BACT|nr:hypothetical protein [Neolewinella xylanilytica]PPK88179.1 hypothetical protein CLV84_1144 [Neolewinella xylanilytica]
MQLLPDHLRFLFLLAMLVGCCTPGRAQKDQSETITPTTEFNNPGYGNPYLPLWEHLPDGEPRVFEDPDKPGKYRMYIIGSHDVRVDSYCGPDIRAWSAPVEDLSDWRDEGSIFTYFIEGQWDVMYAPDLVEVKEADGGKVYYLYPHSRGRGRESMVAKGDRPDGPFTVLNVIQDSTQTVPGSTMGFDPAVYIEYGSDSVDVDTEAGYRAFGYWGFQRSQAGELDPETMYSIRPGKEVIDRFIPSSRRYGEVRDPDAGYPYVFPDQDLGAFNFFEAASIRKIGNKYVWVYSGYSGPDYGLSSTNSALRYAYGDTPLGPWKSGGVLVDSRAVVPNEDGSALQTTYAGHNTHGSIEQINDQWYAFYHRAPRGFGNARQPMVAPVTVDWDEAPVAEGGKVTIRAYDPYAEDETWTASDDRGNTYTGAEVTSEGFQIYGLDPYRYYSAGYACYLSNTRSQSDNWDIWDNSMPVTGVVPGDVIGFKYFGFGGLEEATKGLQPFAGTAPGNETAFNVFLKPLTDQAFEVEVWLDGPYDNATWEGQRIGTVSVPAGSPSETTRFTVDVAEAVDGLDGKHAIFLVAGAADSTALFDLAGLGFSSSTRNIERHVPPSVTISVNGEVIELPETPVRSTNENGIVTLDLYEATYAPRAGGAIPEVTATVSDPAVSIEVEQPDTANGTALVHFNYQGVVKTYRVVPVAR